jgi:hypothetical protein
MKHSISTFPDGQRVVLENTNHLDQHLVHVGSPDIQRSLVLTGIEVSPSKEESNESSEGMKPSNLSLTSNGTIHHTLRVKSHCNSGDRLRWNLGPLLECTRQMPVGLGRNRIRRCRMLHPYLHVAISYKNVTFLYHVTISTVSSCLNVLFCPLSHFGTVCTSYKISHMYI